MSAGPTRGASEKTESTWHARRGLAFGVRLFAFVVPLVASFLVIRMLADTFWRPDGIVGLLVWILQATVVGFGISAVVDRGARRLLPLATLLGMSLVFPDQAPSRFGVALRSGTLRRLRKRLEEGPLISAGDSPAEAAEIAIAAVSALAEHDRLTRGHTERVRAYADLIGQELDLPAADRQRLSWAVLLHDVGKLTVPPEVLNKASKLTDDEWATLRNHPEASREMVEPLRPWLGDWVLAAPEHHERWDGKGYPLGLEGEETSLAGRIASVADAYDVITTKRSYKEPMSPAAARRELVDCAGSQFDPAIVRAFMNVSLGRRFTAGPLAWLADLPIGQITTTAGSAPALAGAIAAGSLLAAPPPPIEDPLPAVELAFVEPDEEVIPVSADGTPRPDTVDARRTPGVGPTATSGPAERTATPTAVGSGGSSPTPTATVVPGEPTPTPIADVLVLPTSTPAPGVSTPTPIAPLPGTTSTPTATPGPAATPSATPTASPTPSPTPIPGGITWGGHTYVAGPTGLTWTAAKSHAEAMGGHLVTITSAAENTFVSTTFAQSNSVWLGFSDTASEGTFVWTTGESFSFTAWADSIPLVRTKQPQDSGGQDYGQMIDDDGNWADVGNGETVWFLGLVPMVPPPTLTVVEFDY